MGEIASEAIVARLADWGIGTVRGLRAPATANGALGAKAEKAADAGPAGAWTPRGWPGPRLPAA